MLARELQHPVREIIYRTSGQTHGPITRLMSPSDLGELLKPFVFLDLAGFDGRFAPTPMGFGWHPHSGIATVTVMLEGAVRYAETTGTEGVLPPGGVEGPGERWTYHPPRGHTVAWVAVHEGVLRTSSPIPSGEIAIFEPSEESIDFVA